MKAYFVVASMFLFACADQQPSREAQQEIDVPVPEKTDTTTAKIADTVAYKITDRFLALVEFADSLGYLYDTARYKWTYSGRYPDSAKIDVINHYVFYEISYLETVPYEQVERCENVKSVRDQKWCTRWGLNSTHFDKVERVMQYYFKAKTPVHYTTEDGIMEEWNFSDSKSAKKFADSLGRKETMVYANRGAYVCFIDNYVYTFHSRSAGFYTPLKWFFTHFVKQYHAMVPNEGNYERGID